MTVSKGFHVSDVVRNYHILVSCQSLSGSYRRSPFISMVDPYRLETFKFRGTRSSYPSASFAPHPQPSFQLYPLSFDQKWLTLISSLWLPLEWSSRMATATSRTSPLRLTAVNGAMVSSIASPTLEPVSLHSYDRV